MIVKCVRHLLQRQQPAWHKRQYFLSLGYQPSFFRRALSTEVTTTIRKAFGTEPQNGTSAVLTQDERRLLGRARLHNIFSHEHLLFEARIGNTHQIGTKLTDGHEHRQDLELWRLIFDVNHHHRGLEGVKATWRAMKSRGPQVHLHEGNPTAAKLWSDFLAVGAVNDIAFLKQICRDCLEKQMLVPHLFMDVVGVLLRYRPNHALEFATILQTHGIRGKDDLLGLFTIACESEVPGALQCFCDVQALIPDVTMYSNIVPRLLELDRIGDAMMMHNYLISQHDLPKTFSDLTPFVRHFAYSGAKLDPFLHGLRAAGVSYEAQVRRLYARERARLVGFHPEALNTTASYTFGREPRKLKDKTIARALATPGFSFDFVLKLLQPFGLIEFGPLSIRQMAITAANLTELRSRFAKLRHYDLDLGSSAYVRLVKRLAEIDDRELLDLVTYTDMHHDEFEDTGLQKILVNQYLQNHDIQQLSRSLAILNAGDISLRAQAGAVNLVLRCAIDLGDWTAVLQLISLARENDHRVERSVVQRICKAVLAPSGSKASIVLSDHDSVGFLVGILQQLIVSGSDVRPSDWLKPLLKLGYDGRISKVERLTRWLAAQYCATGKEDDPTKRFDTTSTPDLDARRLFTPKLMVKVISWGFRKQNWNHALSTTPFKADQAHTMPWLRGPVLLKTLRDQHGIPMVLPDLKDAFIANVRSLYAPAASSRMLANGVHAQNCGVSLDDYMKSWSSFWHAKASKRTEHPRFIRTSHAGRCRRLIRHSLS